MKNRQTEIIKLLWITRVFNINVCINVWVSKKSEYTNIQGVQFNFKSVHVSEKLCMLLLFLSSVTNTVFLRK